MCDMTHSRMRHDSSKWGHAGQPKTTKPKKTAMCIFGMKGCGHSINFCLDFFCVCAVCVRHGAFIWACVGQPKTKNSGVNFAHEGPLQSIVAEKDFVMSGGVDGVIKLWRMER